MIEGGIILRRHKYFAVVTESILVVCVVRVVGLFDQVTAVIVEGVVVVF